MKMFLRDWDALLSPHEPVTALKAWRWLLRAEGGAEQSLDSAAAVTSADAEAFLLIVDEVVMPKLVGAGANWVPKSAESAKLTKLYEVWEPVLPSDAMQQLLHTLVLPKLKTEVEEWNPRVDHVPIHSWLHPWLPLAASDMEDLYPVIR
jgi:tuftelin-interacting protein 11